MKQIGSIATTALKAADGKTGISSGQTGSSQTLAPSNENSVMPVEIAALHPEESQKRALSKLRQLGCDVSYKVVGSKFPPNGGWIPVTKLQVTIKPNSDLSSISKVTDTLVAPATPDQILEWLAELAAITVPRKQGEEDASFSVAAYGKRLTQYPADVVRQALEEMGDTQTFFPAWAEMKKKIEGLLGDRGQIVGEVRAKVNAA